MADVDMVDAATIPLTPSSFVPPSDQTRSTSLPPPSPRLENSNRPPVSAPSKPLHIDLTNLHQPATEQQVQTKPEDAPPSKSEPEPPAKPKSKAVRQRKERSPTPLPPPPPPLLTVRLDLTLGGPDNYAVDIKSLAMASGQRHPTPPPVRRASESEGSDEEESEKQPRGRKRGVNKIVAAALSAVTRKHAAESYDFDDPFIDDSDLAIDERRYFAQTKQQGFYVSSGEVALLKDKTPRKPGPKKKVPPTSKAGGKRTPSPAATGHGTRESPIALLDDGTESSSEKKRKASESSSGSQKKRRVGDSDSFHPEVEAALAHIKELAAKETWEVKGKFPADLKPVLHDAAMLALRHGDYGDKFFNWMPTTFPYNRFTMFKLIKRLVCADHIALLQERQDELLAELKKIADEGYPKALEDWQRAVKNWEERQEMKQKQKADGVTGMDVDGAPPSEDAGHAEDKDKDKPEAPPGKRFKFTEQIRQIVWELVSLSNECCALTNEKNNLEGSNEQISEQGMRKVLYQKIISAFPEGWMQSSIISREVSVMKKKFEKEKAEEGQEDAAD